MIDPLHDGSSRVWLPFSPKTAAPGEPQILTCLCTADITRDAGSYCSTYLSHGPSDAALPSSRRRNPLPSAVHVTTSSHPAVPRNASLSLHEMAVPAEDIFTSSPACKASDLPRNNGIAKQGSNSPPTLAAHQASHGYLWETFLVVSTHSGQRVASEAGANGLWARGSRGGARCPAGQAFWAGPGPALASGSSSRLTNSQSAFNRSRQLSSPSGDHLDADSNLDSRHSPVNGKA